MSEDCIREEIVFLLEKKESSINDFSNIMPEDFVFVKCVNRRVRVPDSQDIYDGEGLKSLYRTGNIIHPTDQIVQQT